MRRLHFMPPNERPRLVGVLLGLLLVGASVHAQPGGAAPEPGGAPEAAGTARLTVPPVVNLSAQASTEVLADTLTVTLRVVRQGSEAARVQNQLRQVLDAALAEARKAAAAPALEVRTGVFNVGPRYGNNAAIIGWQGQAELVLSGTDSALVAALAARLAGLQVVGSGFGVSTALRERFEAELTVQALERFRRRAAAVAQGLGYGDYAVREISVTGADAEPPPRFMPMLAARSADLASTEAAPLPVEPGQVRLTTVVQGSVHLLGRR
jgi:predicted secreted protein